MGLSILQLFKSRSSDFHFQIVLMHTSHKIDPKCLLADTHTLNSNEHCICRLFLNSTHIFLIVSRKSCLCILEINPLSVASFANIFFHSESSLFVLFMVSFAVQKLFSLTRSHLLFLFFHCSSRWIQKRSCCNLCQRVFCLCFPLVVL